MLIYRGSELREESRVASRGYLAIDEPCWRNEAAILIRMRVFPRATRPRIDELSLDNRGLIRDLITIRRSIRRSIRTLARPTKE
jgi:hypothetical protein